jgi:hypothetical protein
MCAAWPGYFGRFTLDVAAATVTHHIDADWFPNLAGVEQVRRYHFDGDTLVLAADTPGARPASSGAAPPDAIRGSGT